MSLLINFLLLGIGVALLVFAGDGLVRGAAALARHWGVPALIVGLTIVAFGTSAPEMVVSVGAVLSGASQLAAGNVIGSNIANVLLALGLPALIMAVPTNIPGVGRNTLINVFATILFITLAFLHNPMIIWQGAILFSGILIYLMWMFRIAKTGAEDPILHEMTDMEVGEGGLGSSTVKSGLFVLFGLIGLAVGGKMIVDNAVIIATALGVSETIIGLTIVAIGTSLPEVATVVIATYRGHPEVAVGSVLGSNIFNLCAVMGAAAMAGPVIIEPQLYVFDMWVMLASIMTLGFIILSRMPIGKKIGVFFVGGYVLYLAALIRTVI